MYQKNIIILDLLLMVLSLAMYRVLPLFAQGFMPMLSISIFAGAVIPNRKLAIALPLISMLLSDFIYQQRKKLFNIIDNLSNKKGDSSN